MKKYLISKFPEESCGLLVGAEFVPCRNVAPNPRTEFQIESSAFKRYAGRIRAVIHSHIDGPFHPSEFDMRRQAETAVPWAIGVISSSGVRDFFWFGRYRSDLRNRPFRHGVTDCYALVRDYYKMNFNLNLPDFPRSWGWWRTSDLLTENFTAAGFRRLSDSDTWQVGDLACIGIKTDVAHHCAIYIGNGRILHHPGGAEPYDPGRKPRIESVYRWIKHIKFRLRYSQSSRPFLIL